MALEFADELGVRPVAPWKRRAFSLGFILVIACGAGALGLVAWGSLSPIRQPELRGLIRTLYFAAFFLFATLFFSISFAAEWRTDRLEKRLRRVLPVTVIPVVVAQIFAGSWDHRPGDLEYLVDK